MTTASTRDTVTHGRTGWLNLQTNRIADRVRRLRDRIATRNALDGLNQRHLRDVGLTMHDRRTLSGPDAPGPDALARRARHRSGNW